jgi:hypothetical protein
VSEGQPKVRCYTIPLAHGRIAHIQVPASFDRRDLEFFQGYLDLLWKHLNVDEETALMTDDERRQARREGAHAAFLWLLDILAQGTASPEKATKAIERIRETMGRPENGEPVRLGEEEL